MRYISPLLTTLSAVCGTVVATQQATSADFKSIVTSNDFVLAAFISPAFQTSKDIVREFDIATKYAQSPLVTVDCSTERELCREYDVASYPSIRLFNGLEKSTRYRGLRKSTPILSFLIKERLPVLTTITSENANEFREIDDTVILAYLDEDDDWLQELMSEIAAEKHKEFVFGVATDPAVLAAHNMTAPSVVSYKRRDNDHKLLQGQFDKETMMTFLRVGTTLIIGEITKRNIQDYVGHAKPVAYIFSENEDSHTALRKELTPIARQYKQYMSFAIIDANEYAHMAVNLELEPNKFPAFVIHNILNDQVYPLDQNKAVTAENVGQLLKDIASGAADKAEKVEEGVNVSDYEDEDDEEEPVAEKAETRDEL